MAVVIDELEVIPAAAEPAPTPAAVEPPTAPALADNLAERLRVREARCERLRAD
jgi:hypothetical protein